MAHHERLMTTSIAVIAIVAVILATAVTAKDVERQLDSPAPCPPLVSWNACPDRATNCSADQTCTGKKICCASACGDVCVEPLLTSCEHYRRSAARRAKSLGIKTSVRVPRCKADGEWERVQCGPNGQGPCWCVDEGGAELPATKAPSRDLVNCTITSERCPAHSCRMLCPLGFALDEATGCSRCECRDPCAGVQCPGNQQCRLQEVACRTQPCPPVPTCKRARTLEELCPVGSPLSIADTRRPFLCGNDPGKPDCPPMYRCLVQRGNEYGVCCPASLNLSKPGTCPGDQDDLSTMMTAVGLMSHQQCTATCQHDLQCPGETKCCNTKACGKQCKQPENATACHRQRLLSEVLAISEREGRGYVPQCDPETGSFLPKQCSRNGLVCWCVHPRTGDKLKGTMGASKDVICPTEIIERASGRSLTDDNKCDKNICAAVCEYGFKDDENGCPTCECEEPCSGYSCPAGHSCSVARDAACEMAGGDKLCESVPVCRPDVLYSNPCLNGVPLTQTNSTSPLFCNSESKCPSNYQCTTLIQEDKQVCCPITKTESDQEADNKSEDLLQESTTDVDRVQTMCEYLRDFSARMEGTITGLELALQSPICENDGSYSPVQCSIHNQRECWCVDRYGTELPLTRSIGNTTRNTCESIRDSTPCLEVSCRMGCDYGFVLNPETGCPTCQCRDPCEGVTCQSGHQCQPVEVACVDGYCPPVPACLPNKPGQCPFLIPPPTGEGEDICSVSCSSDDDCSADKRCCSTGCGTRCMQPEIKTYCQHLQAVQIHRAHESGTPARMTYIAQCDETTGAFKPVQCGPGNNCWCVDERIGQEMPESRTRNGTRPNCNEIPARCPQVLCAAECEHGYKISASGCQSCECIDPCEGVHCGQSSESCRQVELTCSDGPCPSVGVCMPAPENPCNEGVPLERGGREVLCGPPKADACPSTHECRISPLQQKSVCCPKPREVCFEPVHEKCEPINSNNITRWRFNSQSNKCESFGWSTECPTGHNYFETAQACRDVCPVLTQCERLREKNERAAARYGKSTFLPKCDSETGAWEPAQCLGGLTGAEPEQTNSAGLLCWCVDRKGVLLKGSLTRGVEPQCNYRRARGRIQTTTNDNDDIVLEELLRQLTSFNFVETVEESRSFNSPQKSSYPQNNILIPFTNRQLDISLEEDTSAASNQEVNAKINLDDDLLINPTATSNLEKDNNINNSHKKKMLIQPRPPSRTRCEGLRDSHQASYPVACDALGAFTPMQCNGPMCWCVDQAGNQLPGSRTFAPNEHICVPTPIQSVEVVLGVSRDLDQNILPDVLVKEIDSIVRDLGGSVSKHQKETTMKIIPESEPMSVRFHIEGENKVDVAYRLEELVKNQQLSLAGNKPVSIDMTRTRFMHRISDVPIAAESLTFSPRIYQQLSSKTSDINSSSSLDGVTPLQTAVFVLATASAFLVGVFVVFVMLHKGQKNKNLENFHNKAELGDRFLAYGGPIYTNGSSEIKSDLH